MSFNSASTPFATQFGLKSEIPLDCRFVITTAAELAQMIDAALYPGLQFTITSDIITEDEATIAAFRKSSIKAGTYIANITENATTRTVKIDPAGSAYLQYDESLDLLKFVFPD